MNKHVRRCALACGAAAATLAAGQVHAAGWQLLDNGTSFDFFDMTSDFSGTTFANSASLQDQSTPGHFLQSGYAGPYRVLPTGGASMQFSGQQEVDTQGGSSTAKLSLSGEHRLGFTATAAGVASGYSAIQDIGVTGLRLKIQGDAGEAEGSAVRITFLGGPLTEFISGGVMNGLPMAYQDVGYSLMVSIAGQPSASQDFGAGNDVVSLTFDAAVGDIVELTLSLHAASAQDGSVAYSAGQTVRTGINAYFNGDLTVTSAVPEPAGWTLLLAGAGVIAGLGRRRAA